MKKILTVLALSATVGLTACSHDNPLKTQPEDVMVKFIRSASTYAEKQLHYKAYGSGDAYLYCMKGDLNKDPAFCPKLYDYMVEYAKKSNSAFDNLSIDDLKDKQFFESSIRQSSYSFLATPLS